jgi:hypothetical protein
MTAEEWCQIPGYEGRYDVSDIGRVRSWVAPGRPTPWVLALAAQARSVGNYWTVQLSLGTRASARRWFVHRLVLAAFVGPCPDGQVVRHLDGNGENNDLRNLTYGSPSENNYDAVMHGRNHQANKTSCIHGHEFTPENTRILVTGHRRCRECTRIQQRVGYKTSRVA